jgi:hypothetical protein
MRRFAFWIAIGAIIGLVFIVSAEGFLYAAIKEQRFNDNIRAARCERMSDYQRNQMKGYCHD